MITATAVCRRLLALSAEEPRTGSVHSVFDHAVNLSLEGRFGLIGLIAEQKALTPFAVSVRTACPFPEAGVRAGMATEVESGRIRIPAAGLELDLFEADPVDLCVDSIEIRALAGQSGAAQAVLGNVLGAADAEASLAPLATDAGGNVYTRFLAPRLADLTSAVTACDAKAAARAAERFAGCGAGLTPSSDDLLTGYLSTLHLLARARDRASLAAVLREAACAAAKKTNRISATFLLQSGEGLVNQSIYELLSFIFQGAGEETIQAAAGRALAIGSTSGADMLTGIALALRHHDGGNEQW